MNCSLILASAWEEMGFYDGEDVEEEDEEGDDEVEDEEVEDE